MSHEALRTILPVAGWDEEYVRAVDISGDADPILPTSFRIGETSAAALAAVGLAVADLWELRTGRRRDGAHDGRVGQAPAGRRHRLATLDGNSQARRQRAREASRRRSAALGRPRARSHARAGRADLRAHAGRARRRRLEGHRRAPAEPRP